MKYFFYFALAVVSGIIVLGVEYNLFKPDRQSTIESVSETHSIDDPLQEFPQNTKILPTESSSIRIKESIPLALRISSYSQKDSALRELISAATEIDDLNLAIEITDKISSNSSRNSAYVQIIDRAILISEFEIAETAVEKITSYSTKDKQFKKILQAKLNSVEN